MKRFFLVSTAIVVAACSETSAPNRAAAPAAARASVTPSRAAGEAIPDEYIVVFRPDVSDAGGLARQLAAAQGVSIRFVYQAALKGFAGHMSSAAASALARNPNVSYVEQDQVVNAIASETLPGGQPWGIDRIDAHSGLDATYHYSLTGAGVTAYIIDTGIRFSHQEFAGRATSGYDAVDGGSADDCNGHGTHVSGTVGGATYGVAKAVSLVAVRVLDCNGSGSVSGVVAGIDWVTGHAHHPAVANMSLGGGASTTLDDAVRNSISSGVSYAIAAGNGNFAGIAQDACNYSPARVTEAMTIGATSSSDAKASWSNYGNCVDWFAPGVSILSAWNTSDNATNTISGTSMATPHTTGVAALYLQANPTATPQQVRDALFDATTKGIVSNSKTTNDDLLYSPPDGFGSGGGGTTNNPPTAAFTVSCTYLDCTFTDHSTDDNGVVAWTWSFGDGSGSSAQSPSHTYGAANTYSVSLVVTDGAGAKDTATQQVTVSEPPPAAATLTVSKGTKAKGSWTPTLSWTGFSTGGATDVIANGVVIGNVTTDSSGNGSFSYSFKGGGTITYQVCLSGTSTCSNSVLVSF